MDLFSVLFQEIDIIRNLQNFYYVGLAILSFLAVYAAFKERLFRFSMLLWLFSGLICLLWESYLFFTGTRGYNYFAVAELLYHALTEAGPGLILMLLVGNKLGIIDLSEFQEDYNEPSS